MSTVEHSEPSSNPFQVQREYSPAVVELMRELAASRKAGGTEASTPEEVLSVIAALGYQQPTWAVLEKAQETRRFLAALTQYQQDNSVAYPTCEDLLQVLLGVGYHRSVDESATVMNGLPIDRRRREEDERLEKLERRESLEASAQEQMELTDTEHNVLDALKALRQETRREFASSEELLSIVWNLGFRPVSDDGMPVQWLNDDDRCRLQMSFTRAIERKASSSSREEYLSCRSLIEIVHELGLRLG